MTDGEARELARDLVRGSIIEDAAAQFIAQILKHAHDERIKPLRDRAERLEAALRVIADEASVPVHTWKNGINYKKMYEGWRKIAVDRIDIARAALSPAKQEYVAISNARGVRVRQLEWAGPRKLDEGGAAYDAHTTCGQYIATDTGWFLVGRSGWLVATSLETAKAAAQADYEARILAALEPVSAPDPATIREAALVKELSVSNEIGRAFEEDAGQQRARAERLEAALEKMKAEQCAACRAYREIEDRTALTTENRHE